MKDEREILDRVIQSYKRLIEKAQESVGKGATRTSEETGGTSQERGAYERVSEKA